MMLQAGALQPPTLLRKRLQCRFFLCAFFEFFSNTFFIEHLQEAISVFHSFLWRFVLLQIQCMVWRTAFCRRPWDTASALACMTLLKKASQFFKGISKTREYFLKKTTTFELTTSVKFFVLFSRFYKNLTNIFLSIIASKYTTSAILATF